MTGKTGSSQPPSVTSSQGFEFGWSDQTVRLAVLAAAVVLLLWLARGIIGPFIVAGILAYAFSPVVSGVQSRTRLPRAVIIGFGYVVVLAILGGLGFIAAERLNRELTALSSGGHDVIGSGMHKLLGDTVVVFGNT